MSITDIFLEYFHIVRLYVCIHYIAEGNTLRSTLLQN